MHHDAADTVVGVFYQRVRHGDLIHPTNNPETLGKVYLHGCIGLNEKDAWRVCYKAPLETKVIFRYNLKVRNETGDTIILDDIYGLKKK